MPALKTPRRSFPAAAARDPVPGVQVVLQLEGRRLEFPDLFTWLPYRPESTQGWKVALPPARAFSGMVGRALGSLHLRGSSVMLVVLEFPDGRIATFDADHLESFQVLA